MSSTKRGSGAADAYTRMAPNTFKNRMMLTERMYMRVLSELALNRFKWVGLPDSVDERFIELMLFETGLSVFYRDEQFERYMSLRAANNGPVNMYNNPTRFTVIGNTMVNKTLNAKECVPIWANFLRVPDQDIVLLYSNKLAQIERTIEINLLAARHAHVLFVDENERQSYVNLMRQHTEGQPILLGTPGLDLSKIQAFDIGIDKDIVLNLMTAKTKMWNECMTLLGINNSNQDKKERLVSDEVSANNEQISSMRGVALSSRKIAVNQINNMFGLMIDVVWNPTSEDSAPSSDDGFIGGEQNGNVYDNA